ncbi:MAG: YdeI/OmpD-associated family protein [Minisyncoccia bacterium]
MIKKEISSGVAHRVPTDLKSIILASTRITSIWENITPLARNEWICWIESAKKIETRERRIKIMLDKLKKGDRRPCCWAGCPHR